MQIPTTIEVNGRRYEVVSFNIKQTNKSQAVRGIALAQGNLAISGMEGNYRLYNTQSGEPIFKCKFADFQDILDVALIIEEIYADYFDLWKAYPKADLLLWCRYSVPNGEAIHAMKERLDKMDVITRRHIKLAYQEAKMIKERI